MSKKPYEVFHETLQQACGDIPEVIAPFRDVLIHAGDCLIPEGDDILPVIRDDHYRLLRVDVKVDTGVDFVLASALGDSMYLPNCFMVIRVGTDLHDYPTSQANTLSRVVMRTAWVEYDQLLDMSVRMRTQSNYVYLFGGVVNYLTNTLNYTMTRFAVADDKANVVLRQGVLKVEVELHLATLSKNFTNYQTMHQFTETSQPLR